MNGRASDPVWYAAGSDSTEAAAAAGLFTATFGYEPEGVWAAPGRVNLMGEHLDYNGGRCVPFALAQRTYVALARRTDDVLRMVSDHGRAKQGNRRPWTARLAAVAAGSVAGWERYVAGVPWALRRRGYAVPGFDAAVVGRVPVGSGLSSSAALECAVAVALDDVAALGLAADDAGRSVLAAACVEAENVIAGAPTGGLDQAASLRSASHRALLLDCRDYSARYLPLDPAAGGLALLVVDTRVRHSHGSGPYGDRRRVCAEAAAVLDVGALGELDIADLEPAVRRIQQSRSIPGATEEMARLVRHVVTEQARVSAVESLLERGSLSLLGPVLEASHASLRDDFRVSCRELDLACSAAVRAGALGARMTGGGFGGSALALTSADSVEPVTRAVARAFADDGLSAPAFLVAEPSSAAGRVALSDATPTN